MADVMGVVYTSKDNLSLRELTASRALAAIPVAGRYRIIDFTLSNLVNSGVRSVGVIAQKNYHSLMGHLGTGKEWNLHTRNNGLSILPPFLTRENGGEYSGLVDALRANFDFLRRARHPYVIVTDSNYVANVPFEGMIDQHLSSGADVTMMYIRVKPEHMDFAHQDGNVHCFLNLNADGMVEDIEVNPNAASYPNLSMNAFIIKRTLLIHLIDQAAAHGAKMFDSEVLRPYIASGGLKVMGYEFTGYYRCIETINGYFKFNMDLLNREVRRELFETRPIFTKTRDDAPAMYRHGADVRNSLVADGCIIEGSVENCVLFRGVRIARGAKLKDCIVMQDCYIEENVEMENVILDKEVTVRAHGRLIGQRQYPIVIGKNITL